MNGERKDRQDRGAEPVGTPDQTREADRAEVLGSPAPHTEGDDAELVERLFLREEAALEVLSKKYGASCEKIAMNVLGSRADAEECVNDAYLGVWERIPPERPKSLRAYLFAVVRNIAVERYHAGRAAKRNRRYDTSLEELEGCIPSSEGIPSADEEELSEALNAFLRDLHARDRVMFVRRYWYSDSVTEIAARFGVSAHYVSVRLSRIRERLRADLHGKGITVSV